MVYAHTERCGYQKPLPKTVYPLQKQNTQQKHIVQSIPPHPLNKKNTPHPLSRRGHPMLFGWRVGWGFVFCIRVRCFFGWLPVVVVPCLLFGWVLALRFVSCLALLACFCCVGWLGLFPFYCCIVGDYTLLVAGLFFLLLLVYWLLCTVVKSVLNDLVL